MKKHIYWYRYISVVILCLMLVVALSPVLHAQSLQGMVTTDAYVFPVTPGSAEWKAFTSHDEMLEACQIPEAILREMSTESLVETALGYPLYGDIWAYNSPQQGFEAVAAQFNGLAELLTRKDAGKVLLAKYSRMSPLDIEEKWNDTQKGTYSFDIANIEILLSQESILSSLTELELGDLRNDAMKKLLAKQNVGIDGQLTISLTSQLVEGIFKSSDSSLAYYYDYVYTPAGTPVQVIMGLTELTPEQKAAAYAWVAAVYPNATVEAGPTSNYNCHSYAWYNQSTSNTRWMNSPAAYMTDGSYVYHGTYPYYWRAGMKMFYVAEGSHSAILISVNFDYAGYDGWICRSKWGAYPLMRHAASYSPYNSIVIGFYDR